MGDFNVDVKEVSQHLFCNQYKLKSLNKDPLVTRILTTLLVQIYFLLVLQRVSKVLVLQKRAFQISTNLLSRYLKRSTNECLPKLYSTEITKSFNTQFSINSLRKQAENLNSSELDFVTLRKIFIEILDKFAPL